MFLTFLGPAARRFGWSLSAYVLMTNHFHLVKQHCHHPLDDWRSRPEMDPLGRRPKTWWKHGSHERTVEVPRFPHIVRTSPVRREYYQEMAELSQEIKGLLDSVTAFRVEDIEHAELGAVNGFREAQEAKNVLCDYFIRLLEWSLIVGHLVNQVVLERGVEVIRKEGLSMRSIVGEIERLAGEVNTPQFPGQRAGNIKNLKDRTWEAHANLHTLELALRTAQIESSSAETTRIAAALTGCSRRFRSNLTTQRRWRPKSRSC